MSEGDRDELLRRYTEIVHDIRSAKGQQWRALYYSLFLFSAAIAILLSLDQCYKNIILDKSTPLFLSLFFFTIAGIATTYLWILNGRLQLYREQNRAINGLLKTKCGSNISCEIENSLRKKKSPSPWQQNFVSTWLYAVLFSVFIFAGAAAVILVIRFVL